jgi:splicing factor 3B subunit 3
MGASDGGSLDEPEMTTLSTLYLNIGLQNGVLLRTVLDGVTGEMADTRARYLGGKAVKLFKIRTRGNEAVSCLVYL